MADPSSPPETVALTVDAENAGQRIDRYLAVQLPAYSRVFLRKLINDADVKVAGKRTKASYKVHEGDRIEVCLREKPKEGPQPENLPLDILYEDDAIIVLNKPAGMVVHPAKGHWSGTLTSGLQYHFDQLSSVGGPQRPGIVHRLDRETSGVIVVAKTDQAHLRLAEQFEARTVEKEYFATVYGELDRDRDWIRRPIGNHPYQREKMAIRPDHSTSRDAETFYEVEERFVGFTTVRVLPKTGRTHQIRVHLDAIGCPIVCDALYSGRNQLTWGEITSDLSDERVLLNRQALHARRLRLQHPATGEPMAWEAPLHEDLQQLIAALRQHRSR